MTALCVDDPTRVTALLKEVGLKPDVTFNGELRWLFDSPGLRRAFYRRSGVAIDIFGQLLHDRGITYRELDCREVIDLIAEVLQHTNVRQSRRSLETEQNAIGRAIDAEIATRRKTRLRLYECADCGKKHRVADDDDDSFHRHIDPDTDAERFVPFILKTVRLQSLPF